MNRRNDIKAQIRDLIKEYYCGTKNKEESVPGKTKIPLVAPSYD